MKINLDLIVTVLFTSCSDTKEVSLEELISSDEYVHAIATDPEHEVQVIYTQVSRGSSDSVAFQTHTFQTDASKYFYPASTVKMPVALLALQKLNELGIPGLSKHSAMLTDSVEVWQTPAHTDSTSKNGLPSIAHYIKKIFIASDNDAYNRLYEFLGQDYINSQLESKGYENTRIVHRLSTPLSKEQNRTHNPVRFFNDSSLLHAKPAYVSPKISFSDTPVFRGKGYIKNDTLINEPFEFTYKNKFSLKDMHEMLISVMFPEAVNRSKTFNLSKDDYNFLHECMSILPRESEYPNYDPNDYYDAYVKFLLFGNDKTIPKHIKVYNKIGQAYGYMTDNAFIIDEKNDISFFLSATVHANKNGIFNDGIYEYDSVGYPFMKALGKLIYEYELQRK